VVLAGDGRTVFAVVVCFLKANTETTVLGAVTVHVDMKQRILRALSRAQYAAMGAAIGGFLGGLWSRNAASTGAATGALVGAVVGEKRHDFDDIVKGIRESREGDGSEGRLPKVKDGSEGRLAKLRRSAPETDD
jgi:osmotically inducible lipoprotein OsmB